MNRGTYKKILTSLFGIILLFASVFYIFKPNQNETAFAQTFSDLCSADYNNVSFVVTDPLFAKEGGFTENFEKGFMNSTREVEARVRLTGCKDKEVFIEVYSSNNNREDFKRGAGTYTGRDISNGAWQGQTKYKITSDDALVTFKLKAGQQECSGPKCTNYFKINRIRTLKDKQDIVGPRGNVNSIPDIDTLVDSSNSRITNGVITFQKSSSSNILWEFFNTTQSEWVQGSTSVSSNMCSIKDAVIIPANNDSWSNQEWGENFFKTAQPPEVKIQVQTEKCAGKNLYIEVSDENSFANSAKTTSFKSNAVKILHESSLTTFYLRAGDSICADNRIGSDCKISFRAIVEIDATKKVEYNSTSDNIAGVLHYEDNDNQKSEVWTFTKAEEVQGGTIQRTWYWQNAEGVWFNSQKTTKEECEQVRDNATNKKVPPVPCEKNPTGKIADGSQAGEPVITDTCDILGGFTGIGWCFANLVEMLVNVVMGTLTGIAGSFFDLAFDYSISSESYGGRGNELSFIKDSWTLIRDLANLGFIFVLLYMSIQKIISSFHLSFQQLYNHLLSDLLAHHLKI